jgi:hypothetical protein
MSNEHATPNISLINNTYFFVFRIFKHCFEQTHNYTEYLVFKVLRIFILIKILEKEFEHFFLTS